MRLFWKSALVAAALGVSCLASTAAQAQLVAQELVVNGSFASGLTGWTSAPSTTGSAAGTCSYNTDTPPGTETDTGVTGFTTSNARLVLGSQSLTAIGFRNCVLYQDIAIPVGATTLTLSGDFGIKRGGAGTIGTGDQGIFIGLYPTTDVPNFNLSTAYGTRLVVGGASSAAALAPLTHAPINVAPYAGTTIRLAIINAMQSTASGTSAFVPNGYSVIGASRVSASVLAPVPVYEVPTLSEWAMVLLGLMLAGGAVLVMRRQRSV